MLLLATVAEAGNELSHPGAGGGSDGTHGFRLAKGSVGIGIGGVGSENTPEKDSMGKAMGEGG